MRLSSNAASTSLRRADTRLGTGRLTLRFEPEADPLLI